MKIKLININNPFMGISIFIFSFTFTLYSKAFSQPVGIFDDHTDVGRVQSTRLPGHLMVRRLLS